MTIHDFEHKLLGLIDSMVATATDDELFAGGYLRGHISLAVARAWHGADIAYFVNFVVALVVYGGYRRLRSS